MQRSPGRCRLHCASDALCRLQADRSWASDGEELSTFLEDALAKHVKVQLDLQPEAQTQYGPDPT